MEKETYTVTRCVVDALESIPWNREFHCYEFFDLCRMNLTLHGSKANPYDGTLQRIMRMFKDVYGIVCVDRHLSIYMKKKVVDDVE